ncbi:penicillin-binding transpeptidase domain-containing protein [Actinoallomurus purpureus]|uniref:penicillin-binding transpeptidase domain-containing protein n=1 Tax=Actinoallomurus purpureus TaxID=478114 RepID=UPI0020933AA2|nr:penicillin-binding transpeptidase domain-containing protein [Actinoallomurus purpureus]MCO6006522.1 penicillin-binding transpeptidase domain-containing protein [Actinoallomurus purpureus]
MRNKKLWLVVAVVAVVLVGAAGGGAYVLLRTKGSPGETAEEFLAGWRHGDLAAMRAVTVTPPADFDQYYQGLRTGLGATKVDASLGRVTKRGKQATAPFTAALTLPAGVWKYPGSLRLVTSDHKWKVAWTPEAVHPDLHAGRRFTTSYKWPKRGKVVAGDGTAIDGAGVSGSVQQLVGGAAPLTAKQAKKLGTPYAKGDVVGQWGIQQRFDKRLAGTPTTTISTADASGHVEKAVGGFTGKPGQDVKTSLDLRVQQALSNALQGQGKPTSMVAMRPATGQILAVGNIPGGFDRAMQGTYAPGSTFKVVTAYALLQAGLTPSSAVQCPKTANIGGQTIHNSEDEGGGGMTFKNALAQSCNTAFALQTQKLLSAAKLTSAANTFGFNQKIDPGVTVGPGSFPTPTSDAEKAVAGFGQGRDLANALSMVGVAAGVADGTWRPPVLVTEPQVPQKARPARLNSTARSQLEEMMRAVVTSGTAKPAGLPSGTAGKTGTAEFGSAQKGKKPPTHAWFMGYRGDVAFAVVVEGGGFGAKAAAPIAARFLKAL